MTWVLNNLDLIWELTVVHLRQSVIAIILGFLVAVPIGWVAWRFTRLRGSILTVTGLLYTIPSLALLPILPVVLGTLYRSELNLIFALTIYAVALMVRSVADGLDAVDPAVRLSATAMGYGTVRRFFAVDFPLAGPVILAGLRVTAVSTIAVATVGALVGITNLGYLFTNGLQRRIIAEVVAGIIAVVLIAVIIDLVLVAAGRIAMPWTRAQRRRARRGAVPLEVSVA
ncbi:ABC transporter permease [Microbacterium aurantiacum]|uniref:ABC transporter permease n=1 Tax=Microbacterium aurantiacum TaxID=162393 RepID=A0AAJ2HJJ9_9MICO|nr:ABC transporter permease [Microbacterium aurantiacum]MDN4464835.1 ABC transporter permease [Microbacterium aurantiacum]MDS0245705.1 ABC transporter permease [Microbacterium aurantiacum]